MSYFSDCICFCCSENCFTLDNEKYVKEAFQQEGFPEGLEAAKETLKQKNNSGKN